MVKNAIIKRVYIFTKMNANVLQTLFIESFKNEISGGIDKTNSRMNISNSYKR